MSFSQLLRRNLFPPLANLGGDFSAIVGVGLDIVANMASMAAILTVGFGMPKDVVYEYIFPGCAVAVLLGCLALTIYSLHWDRKTGMRIHWTSIPLGLDAPSTIGLPLLVVGPSFVDAVKSGMSDHDAAIQAVHYGTATVFIIGMIKLILAFASSAHKLFHAAGKIGALAGIGFALLGFLQLLTVLTEPVVGLLSLWILLVMMAIRISDKGAPYKLGASAAATVLSAVLGITTFYVMSGAKISVLPLPKNLTFTHPGLHFINVFSDFVGAMQRYVSVALPYAVLVHIGGLTVTYNAQRVKNEYNIPTVLLIDAGATILGAFTGAVTQTTPYIGHGAYHKLGAKSLYNIIVGLFIGLSGIFGGISLLAEILPRPAIVPIIIFVGIEVTAGPLLEAVRFERRKVIRTFRDAVEKHVFASDRGSTADLAASGALSSKQSIHLKHTAKRVRRFYERYDRAAAEELYEKTGTVPDNYDYRADSDSDSEDDSALMEPTQGSSRPIRRERSINRNDPIVDGESLPLVSPAVKKELPKQTIFARIMTPHVEPEPLWTHYTPAIIIALLPTVAQLIQIILSEINGNLLDAPCDTQGVADKYLGGNLSLAQSIAAITVFAHGFIFSGLLWGSTMGYIIDDRPLAATATLVASAVFTFFGVIHSVDSQGKVYWPFSEDRRHCKLLWEWVVAYLVLAALVLGVYLVQKWSARREQTSRVRQFDQPGMSM